MARKTCAQSKPAKARKKRSRESTRSTPFQQPQPRDTFQVVILCDNEEQQELLYDEFRSRNLSVRLLTM